tara:strand:- start:225 stop:446 length:222 start_codon:yes stop_codon:yes gene_type:complete
LCLPPPEIIYLVSQRREDRMVSRSDQDRMTFRDYLLSGPKTDSFDLHRDRDTGRDISLADDDPAPASPAPLTS